MTTHGFSGAFKYQLLYRGPIDRLSLFVAVATSRALLLAFLLDDVMTLFSELSCTWACSDDTSTEHVNGKDPSLFAVQLTAALALE